MQTYQIFLSVCKKISLSPSKRTNYLTFLPNMLRKAFVVDIVESIITKVKEDLILATDQMFEMIVVASLTSSGRPSTHLLISNKNLMHGCKKVRGIKK